MTPHRSCIRILATIFALCAVPAWAQKIATKPFVLASSDGGFSVTIPAGFPHPERKSETSDSENGPMHTTMYTAGSERGACLVSYTMYPQSLFEQATSEQLLDAARDGALGDEKDSLERQEDFQFGEHLARSVNFTTQDDNGNPLYSRFVWIIARPYLYQVGFVGYTRQELEAGDVLHYFESFALTPAKKKGKR